MNFGLYLISFWLFNDLNQYPLKAGGAHTKIMGYQGGPVRNVVSRHRLGGSQRAPRRTLFALGDDLLCDIHSLCALCDDECPYVCTYVCIYIKFTINLL